jgi:hypothetical protein
MKKTLLILFLSAAMILTVTIPVFAVGNDMLQLNKSEFDPGEDIEVTVSNITMRILEEVVFVGIYKKDSFYNEFGEWGNVYELDTSHFTFNAPDEIGEYEMRLYREDENLLAFVAFTVGDISLIAPDNPVDDDGSDVSEIYGESSVDQGDENTHSEDESVRRGLSLFAIIGGIALIIALVVVLVLMRRKK